MTNAKLIKCKDLLVEQTVKDGIVALQIENGRCYGFNETAARIWTLIDAEQSINQLCNTLNQEFEIDPEKCRSEVEKAVALLDSEGLINWVST